MNPRPAAVRIDDLAAPTFPPEAQQVRDLMAPMAADLRLEPEPLMEAAAAQTALDDFGDGWFREPLDVLCGALRTEAGLSPPGTVMVWSQLTQLLKNRLLIQDRLGRNPEIDDVPIARPIVIGGLPRTGTTHLHNLLSSDTSLRSLPYWESLEPVLADAERPAEGEPDPRRARCEQGIAFVDAAMPHFKRMHEMTTDHVHEEIQLLAIGCSSMLFETMALMPSWRDWYTATDQTPAYAYLRTVLKVLQWERGGTTKGAPGTEPKVRPPGVPGLRGPNGTRWVLKSPQHLEQFGPLLATFPDATVVVTHRDPVAVTASVVTMLTYAMRLNVEKVDPLAVGAYWSARIEAMLRACVEDRDLLPARQSIDVRFDEFMADDLAMAARIYAVAGQPMTPEAGAAMERFMVDHPRGRHGGVVYDLAEFGLDGAERRRALQFYVDRFGVAPEA